MRTAQQIITTQALLLRRVPLREADDIVHLFTEQIGAVSAVARGARKGSKRFSGLEPMHTLCVDVALSQARELGTLKEASLSRPRIGLTTRLASMETAGRALRWLRRAAPARTPEPKLWREIVALLDALDEGVNEPPALLASAGMRMLVAAGWGLELLACVRCGKPCPANARTRIDVSAGGVVCRNCGGHGTFVSSRQRASMFAALDGDAFESDVDPQPVLEIVDRALEVHGRGGGT